MGARKIEKKVVDSFGEKLGKKAEESFNDVQKKALEALTAQVEVTPPFEAVKTQQELGAFEIMQGVTVEEMKAMFFNVDALREPPYKVWQLNSKGHRYYYRYDDEGNPEFYPSVTTILSQTLPKSQYLIDWIAKTGVEEAERYKQERGMYGTFMHAQFEELGISRMYDLDSLKNRLRDYMEINRLPNDFIYYADDLKKDVLAFAQFIIDYDVKPMAVEIALVHPYYKYGGMIDYPCIMRESPNSNKYIRAIVDFKSGRKGFYEEAEIQLHMYKDMWNINYPDCEIDRVFNFSPKDWRKCPSYNLKDQTDSPNAKKIPALLELAAIEDLKKDNVFTSVSGTIMLDESPNLTSNVICLTLSELIKSKAPKEDTPDEDKGIKPEEIKAVYENKPNEAKSKTVKAKSDVNGIVSKAEKENASNSLKKAIYQEKKNLLDNNTEI